jgi:uracil-DNA glycosylase family 4
MIEQKLECDGYGCVPADFMFVGISAGRLGALISKVPLTKDASGRIFQRCLFHLGLSKSDENSLAPKLENCYITNLVKSRVLSKNGLNRLPTMREMIDWFPYFKCEVQRVHPKKIIVLGCVVADFLRKTEFRKLLIIVRHPRWYQAHGALNSNSLAFQSMVRDYRKAIFEKE